MNTTVDFETARQLREAGFPHPEETIGQVWTYGEFSFVHLLDGDDFMHNFKEMYYAPTALEIIAQMPGRWLSRDRDGLWHVTWTVTQYYQDERIDACPHRAAAMAFIAWKKGKE